MVVVQGEDIEETAHLRLSAPGGNDSHYGQFDNLLECLLIVARLHNRALTREAALAGLPLERRQPLSPGLFERAARRAGLGCSIVKRPLRQLNPHLFPAVLLCHDHEACVLRGWDEETGGARIVFPDLGEAEVLLPEAELAARYSGRAILIQPRFRFDARAPEVEKVHARHWFWGALADNLPLYRDVLVAAFMLSLFALALPLFIRTVYDRVVPNHAFDTLWVLAAGVVIMLVADLVMRTMRGFFLDLAGKRVDVNISSYIMERVLAVRLENRPLSTGSFAANLRSFEAVRDFITSATVTAFIDLPFAFLFVLVIGWIAWPLALLILGGMALIFLVGLAVMKKMHQLAETSYRGSAQRNATLIESLVGLETVKTLGAEGLMQRKWESSVSFLARTSASLRLLSLSTINIAAWIQQTSSVGAVIIGVYLIAEGKLTMGGLIACSMLSSRAMAPIGQVAGLLMQYHSARIALASLDGILKQPVERPEDANFVSRKCFSGEIQLKGVSFTYPGQQLEALHDISLHIRAGEHVAILGRVGSGKTTLQKLIVGLYQPTAGSVLIDGIDLRQIDPAELRHQVGYVSQDVTLFYGTLRDNLTMGMPGADDTAVLAAAELGGILEFANGHPQGFDMMIGERGESLSGGQRQGVAIGRALIGEPPIVLLDEPTGAMDHSSEEAIKQNLRKATAGKTMIVITHRTSLLELADRIVVIDTGKIVADGPKEQVITALRQGRIGKAA